jgi:hypothetical protein
VVREAAAVFFMDVDGAGGAAWGPAGLEEGVLATTAGPGFRAGGLGGAAGLAETFFARAQPAGRRRLLDGRLRRGLGFAAGFFTVTGSFDDLDAFKGLPGPLPSASRTHVRCSPMANPGVIPPNSASETRAALCRKSHFAFRRTVDAASRNRRAIV